MYLSLLTSFFDRIEYGENGDKYYLYKDVWSDYATELMSSVFMYAAIALAAVLICIGIFVRLKKAEAFGAYLKTAATISITFALTVILTMLSFGFAKISEKGYAEDKDMLLELIPPLVLGGVAVLGIIATYVANFFGKKPFKITLTVTLSAIGAALVATIVCLAVYFSRKIAGDGYYDSPEYGNLNQVALYISAAAFIVVIVAAAFIIDRKNKQPFDSKCISLAGICIALSFALSYIKMFALPQGGSVTLASLLPLMLFSYVYGPKKGVFAGFIYGLLQAMQDAYIIHPAQFILDYPAAFAAIGLSGVFSKLKGLDKVPQVKFALGAILGGTLRYTAHVLSGVFAFGAYAIDSGESNFWVYSLAYNSFVFVDLLIVIVAGIFLFSSKSFVKRVELYAATKEHAPAEAEEETGGEDKQG